MRVSPEAIIEECKRIIGDSVWAWSIGLSDETGDWYIEAFCDDGNAVKKLPKSFKGIPIKGYAIPRPQINRSAT